MKFHRTELKILPSIVFGCGGRGTMAAHHFHELLLKDIFKGDKQGLKDFRPIRVYAVDSVIQPLQDNGQSHDLHTIEISCGDMIWDILNNPQYPLTGNTIKSIGSLFSPDRDYLGELNTLPDSSQGMGTCPPIGRMNFLGSWERIYKELKEDIERHWKNMDRLSGLEITPVEEWTQVFIIAGLYGGTGSGVHIDLAAMIRFIFSEIEIKQPAIYGIFFLPDLAGKVDILRANAYACLKEIDYFLSGNPYEIVLANNKKLTVSNQGGDVLFNKVFLINDRNKYLSQPGFEISSEEAAKMAGEILMHWCCTTVGERINQNQPDAPKRYTQKWVPEGYSNIKDKKISAYSTLGSATAMIPYEKIRKNLVVDFAIETMNTLLLLPDDITDQEVEEIKKSTERLFSEFDRSFSALSSRLKITHKDLSEFFKLTLPKFVNDDINDFMEYNEIENIEDLYRTVKNQTHQLIESASEVSIKEEEFISLFVNEINKVKNELLDSGGPKYCERGLRKIKEHIAKLLRDAEGHQNSANLRQRVDDIIRRGNRKIDEIREKPFWRKFFRERAEIADFKKNVYDPLRRALSQYATGIIADIEIHILERCIRIIEDTLRSLSREKKEFEKILNILRSRYIPYSEDNLHFCPVPEDILHNFIDEFSYPEGGRPEDLAEIIRKEGLQTKIGHLRVNQFDDYPDIVVDGILKKSEEVIDTFSQDLWNKAFSESGFYPISNAPSDNKWFLYAYEKTIEELIKRSTPYIEYEEEGFNTYKETFVILPDAGEDELRKWNSFTLPGNRDAWKFKGDSDSSKYQISLIQFHYGFPLYSIDEIEHWRNEYKKILENERRPLHKFNYKFHDPFINIAKTNEYLKEDIENLYHWAKKITDEGIYPIFIKLPNGIYKIDSDEERIREFYYKLYDEQYLNIDRINKLLEDNTEFKNALFRIVSVCINELTEKGTSSELIENYLGGDRTEKERLLINVLDEFIKLGVTPLKYLKIKDGKIHIEDIAAPEIMPFVKVNFYKKKDRPALREDINDDILIEKLHKDSDFLKIFLEVCENACDFMKQRGNLVPPPEPFNDLLYE